MNLYELLGQLLRNEGLQDQYYNQMQQAINTPRRTYMPVDEYRRMENPFTYALSNYGTDAIQQQPVPMDERDYYIKGGMKHYY